MSNAANTSIGPSTRIVGRVSGDGDLVVEGRIDGEITLRGHLHVAQAGVVMAPLVVGDLTVEGGVEGDVTARGAVILKSAATLRGDIRAERVAFEEGARFSGTIEMSVELPDELARG